MRLLIVIILFASLLQANSLFTFWQTGHHNVSYFKCIKPTANGRIILTLSYRQDQIYQSDLQNIQNALDAGLAVELVNFPTRCQPLEEGLKNLSKTLAGKPIDRIWIALGEESLQCQWKNYTPEDNCQYLQEYIAKASQLGMKIDMAVDALDWLKVFKDQAACPQVNASLLWWFPDDQSDEYTQIGGWDTPYMKIIDEPELCGQYIYVNKVISS